MPRFRVLILMLVALVLTGCQIRLKQRVEIEADGSGTFTYFIGADEEFRELVEQSGGELGLTEEFGDVPDGWVVEETADGGFAGIAITAEFDSIDDLMVLLDEEDPGEGDLSAGLQITQERNTFSFVVDPSPVADTLAESIGTDDISADLFGPDLFDISYELVYSGRLIESNGDGGGTNTLVWHYSLDSGQEDFVATWKAGSPVLGYVNEIDLRLDIDEDESAQLSVQVDLDAEAGELFDGTSIGDYIGELPGGWTLTEAEDGSITRITLQLEASSVGRADRLLRELGEETGLEAVTAQVAALSLDRDGEEYRFEAEAGEVEDGSLPLDPAIQLSVVMPGKVSDSNAEESEDGRLVWGLADAVAGDELQASSSTAGIPVALVAAVAVAMIAIAVVVIAMMRRSRRDRPAPLAGYEEG